MAKRDKRNQDVFDHERHDAPENQTHTHEPKQEGTTVTEATSGGAPAKPSPVSELMRSTGNYFMGRDVGVVTTTTNARTGASSRVEDSRAEVVVIPSAAHNAAAAQHGWREHAHHAGKEMELSEADYRAALAAAMAGEPPHRPALSEFGGFVKQQVNEDRIKAAMERAKKRSAKLESFDEYVFLARHYGSIRVAADIDALGR